MITDGLSEAATSRRAAIDSKTSRREALILEHVDEYVAQRGVGFKHEH